MRTSIVKRLVWGSALVAGLSLLGAAGVGWARFSARAERVYRTEPLELQLPVDPAALARGGHFAHTLAGCAECHGEDFGGRVLGDDFAMRLVAPNLTNGAGSAVRGYEDADWWNAILHGTGRDGRSLLVMPCSALRKFSALDLAEVIAFLRTVPPVDRELGHTEVKPVGAILLGLTNAEVFSAEGLPAIAQPRAAPAPGATRVYGEYLANACRGCHGPDLRGGRTVQPGEPVSADISPAAMATWQFETFERALREGVARDGHTLSDAMPWRATRGLTQEELRALWLGLRQE